MKELITQEPGPVPVYYDLTRELKIKVEGFKYGLSAILMQEGEPIGYALKSLSDCEVSYGQIENELYAINFVWI